MSSFTQRISKVLIEQSLATQEQLDEVLAEASQNGSSFARVLIRRGLISQEKLVEVLAGELGLPMLSLTKYRMDAEVAKTIPERLARQYRLVALSKFGERLVVAMADPLNIFAIDDLKTLTGVAIDPVLAPEDEIQQVIEQLYGGQTVTVGGEVDETAALGADNMDTAVAVLLRGGGDDDAPVVKFINLMVVEAMRRRASDIHLEPLAEGLRIRYRIDGKLIEAHQLPKAIQGALLTRLKIMSGLDITEWRIPQDGRFKVRLDEKEVDFRVSVLPVTQGGKVVLRLLDKANLSIGLNQLGFSDDSIAMFEETVKRPYGMILVTGPTGSGKSTTLYSVLNKLNEATRNIITIEDPVEYQVEGVTQVQVNTEVGLSFAMGLRALLRQSPDVVMIGEIRDFDTADIAMKASLTGQLVLSTLHTNDAPSAVTRLIDMGVEPFLVASSVSLIQAQRLVRRLCTKCRKAYRPDPAVFRALDVKPSNGATFFEAVGCRNCNQTGYRGRMGIMETILMDDRIRELVVSRCQSWEIKDYAIKERGMRPLRQDGLLKAEQGLTTVEEVLGATTEE